MWRPDNWKNPYYMEDIGIGFYNKYPEFGVYEDGADAMLEALLDKGLKVNNISLEHSGKGTIIFIPDKDS